MGLLETLVIGGYVYTTGVFIWLNKKLDRMATNHLQHLVQREVEKQLVIRGQLKREN